jgi:hypothetical protein
MAIKEWQGDAASVAQQDRVAITVANTFAYTMTIGGSTVTYTSSANATKLDIANGLAAVVNSSTSPGQFRRVKAQRVEPSSGDYRVDILSRVDGEPFSLTVGTNLSKSAIAAATGPEHADNTANWGGSLPQNGDTLVFRDTSRSLRWALDTFAAMTFVAVYVYRSFQGKIGNPDFNRESLDAPFAEYRGTKLECGITALEVGLGSGEGSSMIRLDLADVQSAIKVHSTGTAEGEYGALQIVGSGASSTLSVTSGSVDVAWQQGETATLVAIDTTYEDAPESDVVLRCGSGCTLTDVRQHGGANTIRSATTTVALYAGSLRVDSGAHALIELANSSILDYRSTGTLSEVSAGSGDVLDFSANPAGCTVSACSLRKGAQILDPSGGVTWSTGIILDGCGLQDVTINAGQSRTVSVS